MRVLLCHNHYQQPGGEDQVFRDERWLLESHGHDVVVLNRNNDAIQDMAKPQVALAALWNRHTYNEARQIIRQHRPDVMHCTNTFPLISPSVYYAARAEGVPVVQSLHNYRLHCTNGFMLRGGTPCEACHGKILAWPAVWNACYRNSRAATTVVAGMNALHHAIGTWRNTVNLHVTCSEFARAKFVEAGMPSHKVVVKPNFVHPDSGPGAGSGGYAVFVGRLSPEKGIETLLAAWREHSLPIPLKIVGDGPLAARVREAAQQDPRIEWLGWQPLEKVLAIVGDAAMLLMPSLWYEIFGRTIVEGFSKGTPAIASRMGAIPELIEDGRTGLLVKPGDSHDLVEKVTRLWVDEKLRTSMRHACREEFEAKYTAEANYVQLMDIYERARNIAQEGSIGTHRNENVPCASESLADTDSAVAWPRKSNLFGVQVSQTTYAEAVESAISAARRGVSAIISCHAVHALVTSSNDPALRAKVNRFEIVTPDGQPVRWALNLLHRAQLRDRVYGPELMLRLCEAAARETIGIYLYGGTPQSLAQLQTNLLERIQKLMISGSESPPFRSLTPEEDRAMIERINASGAGLVFIGLGCPKQDHFAADHRDSIRGVQVCVGAAFDFHAGVTPMAPGWMQKSGLEWVFRLCREPRRLWRRYLVTNTQFVLKLGTAICASFMASDSLLVESDARYSAQPTQTA